MKQVNNQDEHKKGWKIGYDDGYLKGFWASCQKNDECGRCLNTAKPYWELIPDYGIVELVRIGLEKKKDMLVRMLGPENIEEEIFERVTRRQGISILMIYEEEIKVLADGAGLIMPTIKFKDINLTPTVNTNIVETPEMLSMLVRSIDNAEIVGIPGVSAPNYMPLLTASLKKFGIDLHHKRLTSNTIAYQTLNTGFLGRLLLNGRPPVVIIGPRDSNFQSILVNEGVNVTDTVAITDAMSITKKKINDITEHVCNLSPQIVLISFPVIGPILSTSIKAKCPLIAWGIGHLSPHILADLKSTV
ncbi:MAG: hypothetical protein CVU87_11260 [Firmicutes bacterium HGW-Firmicutes-12]|jgi:hypothetical protein|nr:MAG: hypothetical protein CVU87_11260 [Firmicutes bacterium HGW-Firmicutes-12]